MLAFSDFRKSKFLWLFVAVLFLSQARASLATEKGELRGEKFSDVDFKDGLLKVSVEKQSFKEVMVEVAKKAGIKITIDNPADEELTTSFDYLPLESGLKKLLRGKNYAFKRSWEDQPSGRLTHVMVFGRTEGATVAMVEKKDEITSLDQQQRLDGILQGLSVNGDDLRKQIEEAVKKVKKLGLSKDVKMVKDEIGDNFSLDQADIAEKINKLATGETEIKAGDPTGQDFSFDQAAFSEKIKMALEGIQSSIQPN